MPRLAVRLQNLSNLSSVFEMYVLCFLTLISIQLANESSVLLLLLFLVCFVSLCFLPQLQM